jgi:hypothetical protein
MLKRALAGLVMLGGFMLWRYGGNAAMPALAEEARLAPSPQASSVRFKPGAWACTYEEFKLQVLDHKSYYAKPVVIRIIGDGPAEFCREINTAHDYVLVAPAATDTSAATPCPDHSCVAFDARVAVDGREGEFVLYAPNSFIASSR